MKPSIIRQAEENTGVGITRWWRGVMHAGNRLEGFKPYRPTSNLAHKVHATPRRARKSFLQRALTHTHTHHTVCRMVFVVCMTKTALLPQVPFPPRVYPPNIFSSKFKFLFKEKKLRPPTTHYLCAKKPSQVFLATRHQGCVLLKWYFDRQCNTYFTQRFFI